MRSRGCTCPDDEPGHTSSSCPLFGVPKEVVTPWFTIGRTQSRWIIPIAFATAPRATAPALVDYRGDKDVEFNCELFDVAFLRRVPWLDGEVMQIRGVRGNWGTAGINLVVPGQRDSWNGGDLLVAWANVAWARKRPG